MTPTPEECRRILGVDAGASAETIRQVYLDLVRVWHPDRFQSDARLRQIADDNLCKINSAYAVLKDAPNAPGGEAPPRPRTAETRAASGSNPATNPEEASPKAAPPRFRQPLRQWRVPRGLAIAICCAGPVWAIARAGMLLWAPALDAGPIFRPRILEPMRFIDPSLGVRGGGDALTAWAHGDLMDLWKPVAANAVPGKAAARPPAGVRAHIVRQPEKLPELDATPGNGADLISPARLSGRGDLSLTNQTGLEAVVRLVSDRGATVRAIYIAPNQAAMFRSVAIGVYTVHVELGKSLDVRHLCFLSERSTPAPIGPFQFLEITSDEGVSGSHFQVALKPRT